MRCISMIVISVLAVTVLSNTQSCYNSCSYVYDNRTGIFTPNKQDVKELYRDTSSVSYRTGVFTINGTFKCSHNNEEHLRFRRLSLDGNVSEFQPLIIKLFAIKGPIEIFARIGSTISGKQNLENWKDGNKMNLQISDHVSDSYSIYMNSKHLSYNYDNSWDKFNGKRLGSINSIFSDLHCMLYHYIMICDNTDLQPKICDVSLPSDYQNLVLGSDYSLRCGGTGVPFLELDWKVDYAFGDDKNVMRQSAKISSVATTDDDDHTIKSQMNITRFSLEDLGNYRCSVTNKNYNETTNHTFTLDYKQDIKVKSSPSPRYYKVSDLPISFTWNITGWPLGEIKADCISKNEYEVKNSRSPTDGSSVLNIGTTRKDLYPLPLLSYEFVINSFTNTSHIICTVTNGDLTKYYKTITRVGWNCTPGWYGDEGDCLQCPKGMVSPPAAFEASQCYKETSNCTAGMYGVGTNCTACPEGYTSEDYTVKVEECYPEPGASVGVIVGGSVGGVVFVAAIVVVGMLCVWKSRRAGKSKEEDVKMTRTPGDGASSALPKRSSDPLVVSDPETLYATIDNSAKLKNRKKEPIYDEVHKDNPVADPTYIELDTTTTKRQASPSKPSDTLYSTTLPPDMNNTTYVVLERDTLDKGRRGTTLDRQEEDPTYSTIQPEEPTYSSIDIQRTDTMSSAQQEALYSNVNDVI